MNNDLLPFRFALVGSRTDTAAVMHDTTWGEFCQMLTAPPHDFGTLTLPEYKAATRDVCAQEKDGPGWMPTQLREGGTRRSQDVDYLVGLVLDFDDSTPLEQIRSRLRHLEYALHTTYSHSPEWPRCRVVLPLQQPLAPGSVRDVFDHVNAALGSVADATCGHDPARFYYFPRCPPDAADLFQAWRHEGRLLDATTLNVDLPLSKECERVEQPEPDHCADRPLQTARGGDFKRGFPDGQRTEALVALAGRCAGEGMTEEVSVPKLMTWNLLNDPPLTTEKVLATCKSVFRAEAQRRADIDADQPAQMQKMNEQYAWVERHSRVFRTQYGDFVSTSDLRNTHANQAVEVVVDNRLVKRTAAEAWICSPDRRQVRDVRYAPGKPQEFDRCLNLWTGWGCEPAVGSVEPWQRFLEKLFAADVSAMRWFEQWVAYPLQYPGTKLATTVVLWSATQGVGKTMLGQAIGRLYGPQNFRTITASELHGSFNGWAKGCQFVLGEENSSGDQRADSDKLKHLITGATISVNEKFQPAYEQENVMNFLFTSNHPDAFHLEVHDRRFFVHEVTCGRLDAAVYKEFQDWLQSGGDRALMHHMLALDLTGFDPHAAAPATEAKQRMIDMSRTEVERWLDDLLVPGAMAGIFGREVVSAECLSAMYQRLFNARASTTAIGKALVRLGLQLSDRRRVSLPTGKRVWVQPMVNVDQWRKRDGDAWVTDYQRSSISSALLAL